MIKTWQERCEEHLDHEGIVTHQMIMERMQEEIDELRQALAQPDLAKVGEVGVWGEDREWVGLTDNEARKFYEKYTNREELIYAIDEFLEEKNHADNT